MSKPRRISSTTEPDQRYERWEVGHHDVAFIAQQAGIRSPGGDSLTTILVVAVNAVVVHRSRHATLGEAGAKIEAMRHEVLERLRKADELAFGPIA